MSEDDRERQAVSEMDMLKAHANQLAEHFDTVQIFVTRHDAGELDGTVNANYGTGNWFTRYGQVSTWMTKANERSRKEVREESE